jgi:hypothetical protein
MAYWLLNKLWIVNKKTVRQMKNTQKTYIGSLLLGGLLAATQTSYGGNITIKDQNAGDSTPFISYDSGGNELGFGGGPIGGAAREDNEVEAGYDSFGVHIGAAPGQNWDLEGMSLKNGKLSIVGGFNFMVGQQQEDGTQVDPGHLFIKVGPTPTTRPGFETVQPNHLTPNTFGYTYAIDLVNSKVYSLTDASILANTQNDYFGGNPWAYYSGGNELVGIGATLGMTYEVGLDPTGVFASTDEDTFKDLIGDGADPDSKDHNVLTVNLTSLLNLIGGGQDIWFHYAEQCGNDVLEGYTSTKSNVPDGGASAMLLGAGILGLAYFGRRVKSA